MSITTGKLPLVLILMILIVSTISFLPVQEARASVELAYDDGTAEDGINLEGGGVLAVRFSLTPGLTIAHILTARIFVTKLPSSFKLHIFAIDQTTDLMTPISISPSSTGWQDIDVSAKNVVVAGDFYIAVEYTGGLAWIGEDKSTPIAMRTYWDTLIYTPPWELVNYINAMIRAVIDPIQPVGGVVLPTNKLEIAAPFAALAGLAAALSVVVAVKRRTKA